MFDVTSLRCIEVLFYMCFTITSLHERGGGILRDEPKERLRRRLQRHLLSKISTRRCHSRSVGFVRGICTVDDILRTRPRVANLKAILHINRLSNDKVEKLTYVLLIVFYS